MNKGTPTFIPDSRVIITYKALSSRQWATVKTYLSLMRTLVQIPESSDFSTWFSLIIFSSSVVIFSFSLFSPHSTKIGEKLEWNN